MQIYLTNPNFIKICTLLFTYLYKVHLYRKVHMRKLLDVTDCLDNITNVREIALCNKRVILHKIFKNEANLCLHLPKAETYIFFHKHLILSLWSFISRLFFLMNSTEWQRYFKCLWNNLLNVNQIRLYWDLVMLNTNKQTLS